MEGQYLRLRREGALATLVIDRPDRRGAFNLAMWELLASLLGQVEAREDLRLLVIRGSGGVFSAGADIGEMQSHAADAHWRAANQRAINAAQARLARLSLPTLAFIDGDCIGGGCAIAMACDLRIATARSRLGITPARLGLAYPLHDVKLLTELVGPGQARRLLYTGALIDAEEALRIGLIEQIAASPDEMIGAVLDGSPYAQRAAKQFVRRVLDGKGEDDDDSLALFAEAFDGRDFAEGVEAFAHKRKPRF